MTVRYVGPGGSDSNDGLSWANRKLTLNGVEDTPVVAGDIVYVGPGTYREVLTIGVSGSSGNDIEYIADVTGENTSGVPGRVLVTGSDDDSTASRAYCIDNTAYEYRKFSGFHFSGATTALVVWAGDNLTIADCVFDGGDGSSVIGVQQYASAPDNVFIQSCMFVATDTGVDIGNSSSDTQAITYEIENCLFIGCAISIAISDVSGVLVGSCTLVGGLDGISTSSLTLTESITVKNCLLFGQSVGFNASISGEISSTYCLVSVESNSNWSSGTGDLVQYVPDFHMPLLQQYVRYPAQLIGQILDTSQASRAATFGATTDFLGLARPSGAGKRAIGAFEPFQVARETTTTRGSSAGSIKFPDAGELSFYIPVTSASTTIAVYCYRETNYSGTLPQMVIREFGQADRTTTDTGSSGAWNQLSDTFTPASGTEFVEVVLRSSNTATSGSYATYFDDVEVS